MLSGSGFQFGNIRYLYFYVTAFITLAIHLTCPDPDCLSHIFIAILSLFQRKTKNKELQKKKEEVDPWALPELENTGEKWSGMCCLGSNKQQIR